MSTFGWINVNFFPGSSGVVVNTILPLNVSYPFLTSTFFDKFHFKFQGKSRGSTLNAILCEKGKILTDVTGYTYRSLLTSQGTPTGPY